LKLIKIIFMILVVSNAFTQSTCVSIDSILNNYSEDKYFLFTINVLYKKFHDSNIEPPYTKEFIINRRTKNEGLNILFIPQILIQIDTINDNKINLHIDSINPINRAIIFDKNKYFGSLLFTMYDSILFCPCRRKTSSYTDLYCGKYIYRENNYTKSLKQLLKKEPILIFKEPNFERVWFYVDRNRKTFVFTYESEDYEFEDFYRHKDLSRYSMPTHFVKP
jgi:hypothetical protein